MTSIVLAADMEQRSSQLCEQVKSCVLADLEGQALSAEIKSMVTSSMNGMCDVMAAQFSTVKGDEDLQQQAAACMDSLSSLSCAELTKGVETPACIVLEKRAAAYE